MIRGPPARIAILVAALGCSRGAPTSAPPRTSATALAPGVPQVKATAVVISRKGKVELQRAGGVWSDAQVGDRLAPSDALRTGGSGEAEVGVDGVRMRVLEASSLRLKEATARSLRAQVRGAVESDVDPGKGALDVEVDGREARAL